MARRGLAALALCALGLAALAAWGTAGSAGAAHPYRVTPGAALTHENGTPRAFTAGRLGTAPVMVSLFACDKVTSQPDGNVRFAGRRPHARPGSPDVEITEINGEGESSPAQAAGPVSPRNGQLRFEISGSGSCAAPVVFHDGDRDRLLDLDGSGAATEPFGLGGETMFEPPGITLENADRCDFIDPAVCLQPWPNDHFTVGDPATDTGRRLNLDVRSMPRNRAGVPINPADYNRSDGFSPGQKIVTRVPGLDTPKAFHRTGAVPITDIERSFDRAQPIVLLNADTGQRHPIWSELDANPADRENVNLIIRPAENLEEGGRYIVALRNLRNARGNLIEAQRGFELYRDPVITSRPEVESRRAHFEELFGTLGRAGIKRKSLYAAWDFTVAGRDNLTERMLSIRDDAFAQLGDTDLDDMQVQGSAPSFLITDVQDFTPAEDDRIARQVDGQFIVPCYLDVPGCPTGSRFQFAPGSNLPLRIPGNTTTANFTCLIPRATAGGERVNPARPSLYGHGLLGSAGEVTGGNVKSMANEHNFVFCATDWAGFATQDAATVLTILQDLSNFPKMADRTQQGFLNFLYLGRLMIHPQGLNSHPAFQMGAPLEGVIDTDRLFYDGNSQGGILGGSLTAIAPDFNRAVLGVPGMNYSLLLRRSVDFDLYAEGQFTGVVCDELPEEMCGPVPEDTELGLYDNYPKQLERPLILSMIQMLWDRGEANGYAHHMTANPLPDTPPHRVLMHVAFGDHQVTQWAAEVEARTIGARVHQPALDPGRHPDSNPLFGIPAIDQYPFEGSALVYWDSGPGVVPPPPVTNTPPRAGSDPHGHPRATVGARIQKSKFLRVGGRVVDACGGGACHTDQYAP